MVADNIRSNFSLSGAVDLSSLKHRVDAEPGTQGGAPLAGGYVIDVTQDSFQAVIQTSSTFPVLLLLWVSNDDRLITLATKLGDAVNELQGRIQLARVDIAVYPVIAQALQVQAAPALFGVLAGRPMPIFQGLVSDEELGKVIDAIIPQLCDVAQQNGIQGLAPYADGGGFGAEANASSDMAGACAQSEEIIPAAHEHAHALAQSGQYAQAAQAYAQLVQADAKDVLAKREYAKATLLSRSASADVRLVRSLAADQPHNVEAQLAAGDVDMIGGQVDDAFNRLLSTAALASREDKEIIRERLVEYFDMLQPSDERLVRARRQLATLLY